MGRIWKLVGIAVSILLLLAAFFYYTKDKTAITAAPGQVVELTFELDKKFEFGEYYFGLDNGKTATCLLCFCLTEKNMYPPDCMGDVEYIYNNLPGTTCIPLNIGTGSCSSRVMSSLNFATMFIIPLEYPLTKPFEKIVMGIRVPKNAPENATIVVEVTIFKKGGKGIKTLYRKYEQAIKVKNKK